MAPHPHPDMGQEDLCPSGEGYHVKTKAVNGMLLSAPGPRLSFMEQCRYHCDIAPS